MPFNYFNYILNNQKFFILKQAQQKIMFPQYQMIRDFDLYQQDYQQFNRFSAIVFHKQDFLKQTHDNELETDKLVSLTRSLKTNTSSIQASFGIRIMEQHLLGFKKMLQKYVERCYPTLNKVGPKSLTNDIFQINQQVVFGEQKLKNLIVKDTKFFEQKEKKQFLTDLYFQDKLNEFLSSICNIVNSPITSELIFIANLFWQAYIPKQQIGLSETQIKFLIDQLLQSDNKFKYLQKLQYLNFKRSNTSPDISQKEINQHLTLFLKQYGNTLLLVIEEYFRNPYCKNDDDNQNMKRSLNYKDISNDQFSDDEEQINFFVGHKKRKL